jgi:hypothetical protein
MVDMAKFGPLIHKVSEGATNELQQQRMMRYWAVVTEYIQIVIPVEISHSNSVLVVNANGLQQSNCERCQRIGKGGGRMGHTLAIAIVQVDTGAIGNHVHISVVIPICVIVCQQRHSLEIKKGAEAEEA